MKEPTKCSHPISAFVGTVPGSCPWRATADLVRGRVPPHVSAWLLALSRYASIIRFKDKLQYQTYGKHGKEGHDAYHALLAEDKPEEAALMPYFQDKHQYQTCGRHGKVGRDAYHELLAEDKPEEASLMPYFQDTLQPKRTGGQGGENWLEYQRLIQKGGAIKDLQDHVFIVETTAGEDVE